jgi:hypothetical protein
MKILTTKFLSLTDPDPVYAMSILMNGLPKIIRNKSWGIKKSTTVTDIYFFSIYTVQVNKKIQKFARWKKVDEKVSAHLLVERK